MRATWLTMLVLAASCDQALLSPAPGVPWVRGFQAAAANTPTLAAAQRFSELRTSGGGAPGSPRDPVVDSPGDEHGAIELQANVTGDGRRETVLVSYQAGTVILDAAGRTIASAPGFELSGSADDLISAAVGDGQLRAPLILVAFQSGGHRENTIFLAIYRVHRKRLEQVFLAPIEEHDGMETTVGAVVFVPSGIYYRAPGSSTARRWTFDAQRQRYLETGGSEPGVVLPST